MKNNVLPFSSVLSIFRGELNSIEVSSSTAVVEVLKLSPAHAAEGLELSSRVSRKMKSKDQTKKRIGGLCVNGYECIVWLSG